MEEIENELFALKVGYDKTKNLAFDTQLLDMCKTNSDYLEVIATMGSFASTFNLLSQIYGSNQLIRSKTLSPLDLNKIVVDNIKLGAIYSLIIIPDKNGNLNLDLIKICAKRMNNGTKEFFETFDNPNKDKIELAFFNFVKTKIDKYLDENGLKI